VVALYEREKAIGTLAHIMLPNRASGLRREGENMDNSADVAIPESVRLLESLGGRRGVMAAKIAGGACMFDLSRDGNPDIGRRNVEAAMAILRELNIPLEGEDTGGSRGRSVEFLLATGELRVRTVFGVERTI
jgi:chemotaxis protein CheD